MTGDAQAPANLSPYRPEDQAAFLVGITGHMDPSNPDELKQRLRELFHFLRHGTRHSTTSGDADADFEAADSIRAALAPLTRRTDRSADAIATGSTEAYDQFFNEWPGIQADVPIVVLSSLAPGADQIVATVALEEGFKQTRFELRCPLPFPLPMFRDCSSFVWTTPSNATEEARRAVEAANRERQAQLAQIIPRDDDPRCFVVAMENDLELASSERRQLYAQDLHDPARRHRRYQASGEYIAAYSHLMITIWDHIDDANNDEGTAAIVNVRRSGLTPDILPTTSYLALPPDGPTLQLFTIRERRLAKEHTNPDRAACNPKWSLRWLFPRIRKEHAMRANHVSIDDCDADWQREGLVGFVRAVEALNAIGSRPRASADRAARHLRTFLTYDDQCIAGEFEVTAPLLSGMVKRVADFRRRAADEQQGREVNQAKKTLVTLFVLALLAATLTSTFHHWHSQAHLSYEHGSQPADHRETSNSSSWGKGHSAEVHAKAGGSPADDAHDHGSADSKRPRAAAALATTHHTQLSPSRGKSAELIQVKISLQVVDLLIRFLLGLMGASCAIAVLIYFLKRSAKQHNENANDLRAIAEAARVQMIWHLAGVGKSVSANYMQRQRTELGWIRSTIRSVAMPYEQAKWAFEELDRGLQISLLKCVFYNWIRGHASNAQSDYYADAHRRMVHAIHFWHKTGFVLSIAGLILAFGYTAESFFALWGSNILSNLGSWAWSYRLGWLLLLPAGACAVLFGLCIYRKLSWEQSKDSYLQPFLDFVMHTRDSRTLAHDAQQFQWAMVANFCWYLTTAIPVALLAFLLGVCLEHTSVLLPAVDEWVIILSTALLIIGGLAIAWPERNLYSELAYQYQAMHSLFDMAANRIGRMLDDLQRLHAVSTDRLVASELACEHFSRIVDAEEQAAFNCEKYMSAIQAKADADFPIMLRRIQLALYDLGTEALDENAEWLLLHRARPLEPVMAG